MALHVVDLGYKSKDAEAIAAAVDAHVGFQTRRPGDGASWNRQLAGELGELMGEGGFADFRVTSVAPLTITGQTATLQYLRRVADECRFPRR
jgi:hypothetical protein